MFMSMSLLTLFIIWFLLILLIWLILLKKSDERKKVIVQNITWEWYNRTTSTGQQIYVPDPHIQV